MTEKEFMQQVVQLAKLTGHLVFHTFDSRCSAPGFPDLVIVKTGKPSLFVELKTNHGKLTEAQKEWAKVLRQIPGSDYRLWRPSMWPEIEAELRLKEKA